MYALMFQVAPTVLDILMIEETTTGVSNYNDIHATFEQKKGVAVTKLLESIRETQAQAEI